MSLKFTYIIQSCDLINELFGACVQLMQHVSFPPVTTEDPDRLMQEFPKWLEKVSSRLPRGIVLVIDAADLCQVLIFFKHLIIYN